MIDFAPTEEQTAIRDLAHQIAMEQFRKHARAAEEAGDMPASIRQVVAETGLLAPFPEAYGGDGAQDAVTHALIMEELAYGDGGLALHVLGSVLGPLAVLTAGDEGEKQAFLPPCRSIGSALGLSEPAAGWDVRHMTSTLRDNGDDLQLEINKRGVIHGQTRGLRLALLRLADTPGLDGLRLLVLTRDEQMVEVIPEQEPLGLRAAPRAHWRVRAGGDAGGSIMLSSKDGGAGVQRFVALANVLLGSLAVGIARAALDYAADYAKGRVQFGRPISSFQAIAFMAAEMAMETDAARLLVWRAAHACDTGEDAGARATNGSENAEAQPRQAPAAAGVLRLAERARMQAVKVAQRVTTDAVQILGGAGFLQDHPVELWMRDAEALAALG